MKVLKILMKLIGINSLYRYKLMPFRKLLGLLGIYYSDID